MRGYQLLIFFCFINYCCCDSKIVEHLEKQLNNLIRKRNNGKPLIINGKMKKYRCIEEYIPVDEYGSIIEKEPLKPSSTLSSPPSSMNQAKGISQAEPKGGGYFTTTTTTLAPNPVEADSEAISPNGLNIQRIKHSSTPKYAENNEKKSLHSDSPRSLPVEGNPDTTEFIDEEPEIRRSSERRPSQFRRPPQREYDDYQYFESDRDYLGPEYYPRPTRIPYYSSSRSRVPTMNPHIKGISSYETRRPILYNGNEYIGRHYYPPPQPRPLPRGRDDRWQSPIPVHALPPQRHQFAQPSHPLRPLPSPSNLNGVQSRPLPPNPFPTLTPHPLPASPPPRQHPLPQIPQHPQPSSSQQHPPQHPPPTTSAPKKNLQMTPENCQKVKSFAANFGVKNPQTWVRQNCLFAQTFVPNTSCEDLATFVDSCYRHHFL